MTEETPQGPGAGFNLSLLDPSSYPEPKELIPVRVKVSQLRWSDPKYNEATEFRAAFPNRGHGPTGNSIQQWELILERLDAVYVHEDGSHFFDADGNDQGAEVAAIIYGGVDLEKLDKKSGNIHGLAKARGKEAMTVNAWTKLVGSLVPDPSHIVGQMFMVENYREKEIAPGFFAKNVTLPVETLPPTYEFTGTVQRFKAKTADSTDGGTSDGAVQHGGQAQTSGAVSQVEAAKLIQQYLSENGLTADGVDVSVLGAPGFPAAARIEPFTTAFATGTLAGTLDDILSGSEEGA